MFRHLLNAAALAALGTAASAQVLIMTNSTTDTLVSFDPLDGSVINASLFAIPNTVQVSAIDVNGEIWISEQTGDRIVRYDSAGNVLGQIGPTHSGGGLDNIRGMGFINGQIYVTNSGTQNGAPGNAVVIFDTAGNYVSHFNATGFAPSPFSVLAFQGDLLVASSSANDDVHRFDLAGNSIGTFHNSTSLNFAHQLAPASDGNVWCGGFSSNNVVKLDASTGAVLSSFTASGARGVFELGNGNVMWTNGTGAHVYDPNTNSSTMILAGSSYHLNLYGGAPPTEAYCFGDGSGTACPCGNTGGTGRGCDNGTGSTGGQLGRSGSTSIGAGDLVLVGSGLEASQPGLYFQGNNAVNGGAGTAFGDGLRCAGGGVVRLQVRVADISGVSSTTVNVGSVGGVAPGDVKRYQLWYRNPNFSLCGSGYNFTNGLELTWAP